MQKARLPLVSKAWMNGVASAPSSGESASKVKSPFRVKVRVRSVAGSATARCVRATGNRFWGWISTSVRSSADRPPGLPSMATAGTESCPRTVRHASTSPPVRAIRSISVPLLLIRAT